MNHGSPSPASGGGRSSHRNVKAVMEEKQMEVVKGLEDVLSSSCHHRWQLGGAVAAAELQPVVKHFEFLKKQWGEKKSHY